jgi:hypothetical protein
MAEKDRKSWRQSILKRTNTSGQEKKFKSGPDSEDSSRTRSSSKKKHLQTLDSQEDVNIKHQKDKKPRTFSVLPPEEESGDYTKVGNSSWNHWRNTSS